MDCADLPIVQGRDFFNRLKAKTPDHRLPLSGSLELTYRCNLKCVHCYQGDRRFHQHPEELSTEEVFRIVDEIAAEGCFNLLITGGEPFVRPDLFDILKYIKHKGILVTLFTNGTYITPETIARLLQAVPNMIEITLYGLTQETYEKVTGIPGSFQKCMDGIRLLKEHGIPFKLKTMVITINYHELAGMKAFAENLGVDFRFDAMIHADLDYSKEPNLYRITPEQVILADQIDENKLKQLQRTSMMKLEKSPSPVQKFHCGAGINGFHIDPSGKLSLCLMVRNPSFDLRLGNFNAGWHDFLKEQRFKNLSYSTPCNDCELFVLCGECPGRSDVEQDSSTNPNSFFCKVAHLRDALVKSGNYPSSETL